MRNVLKKIEITHTQKNGFSIQLHLTRKIMLNPIHLKDSKRMYPVRVEYVFIDTCDTNDPILRKIIEYCSLMKIEFQIREFNPTELEEDKCNIEKLPAIQLYEKNYYADTCYPEINPIPKIQSIYEKLELEHLEYLSKKQIWDEKLKFLKRIFRLNSSKTDLRGSNIRSNH
jgi:hypothetical protein